MVEEDGQLPEELSVCVCVCFLLTCLNESKLLSLYFLVFLFFQKGDVWAEAEEEEEESREGVNPSQQGCPR